MPRRSKVLRVSVGIAVAAILAPALALGALQADNEPGNLIVNGDFESRVLSLRMAAVSPFPLVAGGWGVRSDRAEGATVVRSDNGTRQVLLIDSSRELPTYAVQDVAVGSRGFVLEFTVERVRGQQSLALFGPWDRMDPESAALLRVVIRPAGLRVIGRNAQWSIAHDLRDGAARVRLTSDPRRGVVDVSLDDVLAASLPAVPDLAPRTVVLGGAPGGPASRYRYDHVALYRLSEIELAQIRRDALRVIAPEVLEPLLRRLDGAARALGSGRNGLAAPELRAAARYLETLGVAEADASVIDRMLQLAELTGDR